MDYQSAREQLLERASKRARKTHSNKENVTCLEFLQSGTQHEITPIPPTNLLEGEWRFACGVCNSKPVGMGPPENAKRLVWHVGRQCHINALAERKRALEAALVRTSQEAPEPVVFAAPAD